MGTRKDREVQSNTMAYNHQFWDEKCIEAKTLMGKA